MRLPYQILWDSLKHLSILLQNSTDTISTDFTHRGSSRRGRGLGLIEGGLRHLWGTALLETHSYKESVRIIILIHGHPLFLQHHRNAETMGRRRERALHSAANLPSWRQTTSMEQGLQLVNSPPPLSLTNMGHWLKIRFSARGLTYNLRTFAVQPLQKQLHKD